MKVLLPGILTCLLINVSALRSANPTPSELFLRGYSVIPAPQKVQLGAGEVILDDSWGYKASHLPANHIALRSLLCDMEKWHAVELKKAGSKATKSILLETVGATVKSGAAAAIDSQAYRLTISPSSIRITGNSDQGLFYGVQTFLQLLQQDHRGRLFLPAGEIEDWPATQLRFLHWDTKHHQDRMETLKRYLDWSARFKINMIGFELEDKFEYPSHPVIGAPGAFTTAELQEIVNYGLERFIQVVPQVQAPAHMAYVLKHPEFAALRSDGSNYQVCLCDPRSYDLIFSMYDDLIKATRGIDYFFVSTDEVYYAGICAKCSRPYNPENRSLQWAEFVRQAHDFLEKRHRRMLAWVEYPFLKQHTTLLPKDIIDGILGSDPEELQLELAHGMDHLAYTPLQGEELLFPNHFGYLSPNGYVKGRLEIARQEIAERVRTIKPIGVFGAAWGDSGLHNETFWLGWATVAQQGWSSGRAPADQTVSDFMKIYYGPSSSGVVELYELLEKQAQFFDSSWDKVVSRVRGAGYGNSRGKGVGTVRYDRALPAPALPSLPGLDFVSSYQENYQLRVKEAASLLVENDRLNRSLTQKMLEVSRNRYNLEVFQSLAQLTGHHERLLLGMQSIEENLRRAREAVLGANPWGALDRLAQAYRQGGDLVAERREIFKGLQQTWEKSQFPKGREAGGRQFVHTLDDVKDHFADRRPDLSYMIAPEESIGLERWMENLDQLAKSFMEIHKLPVRSLKDFYQDQEHE
jgi:hexosaminidase